jgi:hypothetical protein
VEDRDAADDKKGWAGVKAEEEATDVTMLWNGVAAGGAVLAEAVET